MRRSECVNALQNAAQIVVGDFCFYAGMPNADLVKQAAAPIIVPRDIEWCRLIKSIWGDRVEKALRYALKKEPDVLTPKSSLNMQIYWMKSILLS
jgi:hypothetical protein